MTPLEIVLIIILIAVTLFLVYYFFRGSTGNLAISRPVESRVDEYLDRKFDQMIEEWSLVRKPQLQKFKDERNDLLDHDEERIQKLKEYEAEMKKNLTELEGRLDTLENTLEIKKSGKC
ncbi:MAG: hypothetical protein GXY48_02735 [Methanomicrobiales archaeon]|nr:hypothetical protein [Methanomicrobiales archaeon]